MHVAIRAVWSTTRPLESNLLHRKNYQITFGLSILQMNFPITSHIDVDCQVVTRAGRLIILTLVFGNVLILFQSVNGLQYHLQV